MSIELSMVARSSILLLGTALLTATLRRASASTRYALWIIGLAAALILPGVFLLLPSVDLPLLSDSHPAIMQPQVSVSRLAEPSFPLERSSLAQPVLSGMAPATPSTDAPPTTMAESPANRPWSTREWLGLGWMLGMLVVCSRVALGFRAVRRLKVSSRHVSADWAKNLLSDVQRTFSIEAPVELRIGGDATSPMTWGIFRHTILLPSASIAWTEDRMRVVLGHELAHAKRRDGLTQTFIQAACAFYWFNPLVWYAAYRTRVERECACDDQVLNLGINAEDYADHLLGIARSINAGWTTAALSMVSASHFESRLRAILDATRNRKTLSRVSTSGLLAVAGLLTVLTGTTSLTTFAMPALPHLLVAESPSAEPLKSYSQRTAVPAPLPAPSRTAVLMGMEFLKIAPGTFLMGCTPGDTDCAENEKPSHRVRITKAFEIGKYEVTQAQWKTVMGDNPSSFSGLDLPVESVTWDQVHDFLTRLNGRNDGYRYRLPTEAEWEYAAKAGSATAAPASLDSIAWYANNSGQAALDSVFLVTSRTPGYTRILHDNGNQPHAVGHKLANGWGLYDMMGNVQEMVQDWYDGNFYKVSPTNDPTGPANGYQHIARGGWFGSSGLNSASSVRSSSRQVFSEQTFSDTTLVNALKVGSPESKWLYSIETEGNPDTRIQLLLDFEKQFPYSQLQPTIYTLLMQMYVSRKDTAKVIEFGEKAIKADPEDFEALLTVSRSYIFNQTHLDVAVQYAQRAIDVIAQKGAAPPLSNYSEAQWKEYLHNLSDSAKALRDFAMVSPRQALDAFQAAQASRPQPSGSNTHVEGSPNRGFRCIREVRPPINRR